MNLGYLSEPATRHDLSHFSDRWIKTARVRDHELDPFFFRRLDHPVAVFQRERHRLLNHNMLAVFDGGQCMLGVKKIRRSDIDDVHRVTATHFLNALEHLDAVLQSVVFSCFLAVVRPCEKFVA